MSSTVVFKGVPNNLLIVSVFIVAPSLILLRVRGRRLFSASLETFARRVQRDTRWLGFLQFATAALLANRASKSLDAEESFWEPESVQRGWWAGIRAGLFAVNASASCTIGTHFMFRWIVMLLSPILVAGDLASELFMTRDIHCMLEGPCRDTADLNEAEFLNTFVIRDLISVYITVSLWTYIFMASVWMGFCRNRVVTRAKEHRQLELATSADNDHMDIELLVPKKP